MKEYKDEDVIKNGFGVPIHNHFTRDIKKRGVCPACDISHGDDQFPAADSEGNYHT